MNFSEVFVTKEWVNDSLNTKISSQDLERLNYQSFSTDIVFLGNTSGTTGKKKYFYQTAAIFRSIYDLMDRVYFPNNTQNFISIYGVSAWFVYSACSIVLTKGGTVVFTALDNIYESIVNYPNSYSTLIIRDVNYLAKNFPNGFGDQKMTTFRAQGSYFPRHSRLWLRKHLSKIVINSYSANETFQVAEMDEDRVCTLYPDVQIRIVDSQWNDLPQGESGHITIQSPRQVSGYLWNPELNIEHFKEGWFRSNDIGYLTPEGNLVLVDRADNMLNLAGIKVPPAPIEAQIKLLPGVDDCVLLEEDTLSDLQTIAICIEVSKAIDRSSLEKAVIAVLAKRFKSYRFYFLPNFPRTETGKVRRKELQQQIVDAVRKNASQ